MQRYFKDTDNNIFTLSSDDSYHITKVMRMKEKDNVEVVINGKLFLCEIIEINNLVTVKRIREIDVNSELSCRVILVQSLVKEQKMDYILQKVTELGVSEIIPLNTTRSVVKLDKGDNKKINRWQKIVKEASEQSKRLKIPEVKEIANIDDIIGYRADLKILCTVNELSTTIKRVLPNELDGVTIILVIGPEGGFTDVEEEKLIKDGYISTSFGNRVLRTETASLYALSIINYILMR